MSKPKRLRHRRAKAAGAGHAAGRPSGQNSSQTAGPNTGPNAGPKTGSSGRSHTAKGGRSGARSRAAQARKGGQRLRHFYDVRQYAILTDAEDHVLILQLPKDYDEGAANAWTLPGGKLEPDDEPGAGLLREIKEETGLAPEHVPVICGLTRWTTKASKKLAVFYRTTVPGVKPELTLSGEHQRAVWAAPADLDGFPFHRPEMLATVQRVLKGDPA